MRNGKRDMWDEKNEKEKTMGRHMERRKREKEEK